MGEIIRGNRRLNGNWGKLWWDGELIAEIESFEAKISAEREDVIVGQSFDSKITGLKGEGTIKVKKVYTRGVQKLLSAWQAGNDVRSQLIGLLYDPDSISKQKERVVFNNVWFNEITLGQFEKGKVIEQEFPFGFTPEDTQILEAIL